MQRFHLFAIRTAIVAVVLGIAFLPVYAQAQAGDRVAVLIGFNQIPGPAEQGLVRAFGGTVKYSYTLVPAIAASVPAAALDGLRHNPMVREVNEDLQIFASAASDYTQVWGVVKVNAPAAHDAGITGSAVKVAIIDTGVDCSHPELLTCAAGYDFVAKDSNPFDENGHGTHVAGTIAAGLGTASNGVSGVAGVAPTATIIPLRVLDANGSGYFSDVIAALQWIATYNSNNPAAPVRVTNNSYGSSGNPGADVQAAFDAISGTVLHVAAAGNASLFTCTSVGYPAAYASVVAVAALTSSNAQASWSCSGAEVELAAPGASIYSTAPNGGYATMSGTSMASPHVAGAAALVFAANSGITPDQVRTRLRQTALDLGTAGWDRYTGYGLIDAYKAATNSTGPVLTGPVHIGDLDATAKGNKNGWTASVTAAVHDLSHAPVPSAVVRGSWSTGGTASCTTGSTGTCTVTSSRMSKNVPSATFTVTNVSHSLGYDLNSNHDVDGGSSGTAITIAKP